MTIEELREKWKDLGLPEEQLEAILQLDSFGEEVEWMKFLALGCSVLGGVRSQQELTLISKPKWLSRIIIQDSPQNN